MTRRMIYVGQGDQTFWVRAEKRAREQGVSLSKYVSRLVRADITKVAPTTAPTVSDHLNALEGALQGLKSTLQKAEDVQ